MLPRDAYGGSNKDNQCFNEEDYAAEDGLQNISPCQYGKSLKVNEIYMIFNVMSTSLGAPVYISNPHFYESNQKFLDEVEGLEPNRDLHETYFKIQPVSALK